MMGKIKNDMKEVGLAFIMFIIVAAGVIASAAAFNYAMTTGVIYAIAGILNLGGTVFSGVSFYKKYLKPTES